MPVATSTAPFFLDELPYDVSLIILSHLSLRERVRCTQVSKAWRSLVLYSPPMWHEIFGCNISRDLAPYKIDGRDIHKIDLQDQDDVTLLINLGCSTIQTITNACYNPNLQDLLNMCGPTLTDLDVFTIDWNIDDFLHTIFTACPNLTRLRCVCRRMSPPSPSSDNLQPNIKNRSIVTSTGKRSLFDAYTSIHEAMQRVTDLELSVPYIDTDTLKRILALFGNLRHLYLREPYQKGDFLMWLNSMFPSLQTIRFGKNFYECSPSRFSKLPPGYKALAYNDMAIGQEGVGTMLETHGRDMGALHMRADLGWSMAFSMVQRFVYYGAPHLQSLAIQSRQICGPLVDLDHLLRQFPCLEQLVLENISFIQTPSNDTATATAGHKRPLSSYLIQDTVSTPQPYLTLKTAKFVNCKGLEPAKLMSTICRFDSYMDSVSLVESGDLPKYVLDALSIRVESLEQLVLGSRNLSDRNVQRLIDNWSVGKKKLKSLQITSLSKDASPAELTHFAKQILTQTHIDISTPSHNSHY
ncbi:hypothetical protein BDB00DRAFT_141701 [Zychaea mexicana]|uniref:uncharacterized protein n=1 Tax=Zychaea mexicana TaxID=64656 RepID=UPI0022FEEBDC|nr:uncharacterized protein BDB00DRAFT_141701 [Zychaea mexicana]KAI9496296.1 hypothetical protein BDB00DRAFT_141701 [Zychaea mexicana]